MKEIAGAMLFSCALIASAFERISLLFLTTSGKMTLAKFELTFALAFPIKIKPPGMKSCISASCCLLVMKTTWHGFQYNANRIALFFHFFFNPFCLLGFPIRCPPGLLMCVGIGTHVRRHRCRWAWVPVGNSLFYLESIISQTIISNLFLSYLGKRKPFRFYCRKGYFFSISFFIGKKPNRLFPQLLLVPLR